MAATRYHRAKRPGEREDWQRIGEDITSLLRAFYFLDENGAAIVQQARTMDKDGRIADDEKAGDTIGVSPQPREKRNVRADASGVTHCDSQRFPKGLRPRG